MSEMTDENCKTKKNIKNTPLSVTEILECWGKLKA